MGILPSIDLSATGIRIAQLRQQTGLTVQDLQNIFGFSTPQAIYKWQRGAALPTLDNLVVLASVFGTTLDSIIVRTGDADQSRSA
jgi:transcriptional regulator with XRE-family HTH domain